jgi:hypothetical protein
MAAGFVAPEGHLPEESRRSNAMGSPQEPHPVAYGLREIRLNDGVSRDTFKKFMLETLFPTVDTSQGSGFGPDQHTLLQQDWPSDVYVWMSRVEY